MLFIFLGRGMRENEKNNYICKVSANKINCDEMNGNKLKIWVVLFCNEIGSEEVSAFRGAVVANSGSESLLFHNHASDEGFRYRYPLIQYKRIHRKAAIVCVI